MIKLILEFLRLKPKKPSKKLRWCIEDFELGKKWSKSEPHPFSKTKTLWDYCYDSKDSVYTIQKLNTFIEI